MSFHVVLVLDEEQFFPMDLDPTLTVRELQELFSFEINRSPDHQTWWYRQQLLEPNVTLLEANVLSNEMISVRHKPRTRGLRQTREHEQKERQLSPMVSSVVFPANEMDPGYQRKVEEQIQQVNIEQNMALALEHNPESFGSVSMLFVHIKVNGRETVAFVDSGAQRTIMNGSTAKQLGISHLLDTRFSGVASGIGTRPIKGRILAVQLQLGTKYLL